MIASSMYELALKYPGCVKLHMDIHKDPFWDRPYLMCTSMIYHVDDFKLHLSFLINDIDSAAQQITGDLRNVAPWCCQDSLLINPDKTKLFLLALVECCKMCLQNWIYMLLY